MTKGDRGEAEVEVGLRRFFAALGGAALSTVETASRPSSLASPIGSGPIGNGPIGPFGSTPRLFHLDPGRVVASAPAADKQAETTFRISARQLVVFGHVLGAGTAICMAAQRVHEAPSPAATKQLVGHLRMLHLDTMRRLAEGLERLDEDRSGCG